VVVECEDCQEAVLYCDADDHGCLPQVQKNLVSVNKKLEEAKGMLKLKD
jgi:hypothetical protein